MQVGAIVVNWNDTEATARCIESLLDNNPDRLLPIVVDNASLTDPTAYIEARAPEARVLRLQTNLGYAAGCNAGAREALALGATHLLFMNNDLEIEPGAVAALVEASQTYPDAILAPLVVRADKPDLVWAAGAAVTLPWMDNWHLGRDDSRSSIRSGQVDWAPGCALFVNAETWSQIGPLDETYFLYLEDLDWCLGARLRKRSTRCVAEAVVRHVGSLTAQRALTAADVHYYGCRNTHRLAWKHSRGPVRAWVGVTAAWSALKAGLKAVMSSRGRNDPLHAARLQALVDFLRGASGPSPLHLPKVTAVGSPGHVGPDA